MIAIVVLIALLLAGVHNARVGVRTEHEIFEQSFANLKQWESTEDDPTWMRDTLEHAFDWEEEERWEQFLAGRAVAA